MMKYVRRSLSRRVVSGWSGVLALVLAVLPVSLAAHSDIHEQIQDLAGRIAEDPANPQWYLQRGDLYRIHRDWDHARADFRRARELGTPAADTELGLGRTALDQGSPQQALVHLNRALAERPNSVRALVIRAQAYRALGRPLAAAADYNRVIEQFPPPGKPLPEYYLERARAYVAAGEPHIDKALQSLDDGTEVLGNLRTFALYAVELERQRGDFEGALRRLDPILARATRREFLLLERGDILAAANRQPEAQQDYLAARAAIATLAPRHRHTHAVQQLESTLNARLQAAAQQNDQEP